MKSRLLWGALLAAALAGFYFGTVGQGRRTGPVAVDRERIEREFADFRVPALPVPALPRAEIHVPLPASARPAEPPPPARAAP